MVERFQRHIKETGLIPEGSTVLLGYSGGADSTCLLHLMSLAGTDVIAAHLHHGQREEGDAELTECAAFCERLGVPFMSGKADVPGLARAAKIGLEEAGRNARYEFFEQCRHQTDADLVATAHTQDDHVETVLLNMTRGTGLHGLAGIQQRRGHIVRPLLIFTRAEARQYCERNDLWFHDDPANDDPSFSRVKVRQSVVPVLETINPAVRSAIEKLASMADREDRFLEGMAAAALEKAELPLNGDLKFVSQDCEAAFGREALLDLPHVLLGRAIRLATGAIGQALDYDQTSIVIDGLASEPKGSVTAEGGQVVVEWDETKVLFRALNVDAPYRFPLTLPGETVSDEFGWKLTAESTGHSNYRREPRSLDVVIDSGAVKGSLFFRSYEQGDTIQPLGFDRKKKLGELFGELGLTQAARTRLPIVCDEEGPVWVPGGCIAERVKVRTGSDRCISLRFEPI